MTASSHATTSVVKIMMAMYDEIEQYRKENDALRELLLQKGLTQRQLRKEMNVLLKSPKSLAADQLFRELCEGMRVFL